MLDWIRNHILNRGDKAKALVDNTAYEEAVNDIRQKYIEIIIDSAAHDTQAREIAYFGLKALADVDRQLRVYVSDAKYELGKDNQPQNGANT